MRTQNDVIRLHAEDSLNLLNQQHRRSYEEQVGLYPYPASVRAAAVAAKEDVHVYTSRRCQK
jgi:hypothetical protein